MKFKRQYNELTYLTASIPVQLNWTLVQGLEFLNKI